MFIRFPLVDILSRSGDIRDQSLKLSKIVQNFGLFCFLYFFGLRASIKFVPKVLYLSHGTSRDSVIKLLSLTAKLLRLIGWILSHSLIFIVKNCWGDPRSSLEPTWSHRLRRKSDWDNLGVKIRLLGTSCGPNAIALAYIQHAECWFWAGKH